MSITPDNGPWKIGEWSANEKMAIRQAVNRNPRVFKKGDAIKLSLRLRRTPEAVRMMAYQIRKELKT